MFLLNIILCKKNKWLHFFMAHKMCLNLWTQTKVCSPAWVLKSRCFSFILAGENFARQVGDTWFLKWKTSIIFSTLSQMLSSGGASGSGCRTTSRRSRLHMLSYARMTAGNESHCFTKRISHCRSIRNTCEGDSDLMYENNTTIRQLTIWDIEYQQTCAQSVRADLDWYALWIYSYVRVTVEPL